MRMMKTAGGRAIPSSYAHAHDLTVAQVDKKEEQRAGDVASLFTRMEGTTS